MLTGSMILLDSCGLEPASRNAVRATLTDFLIDYGSIGGFFHSLIAVSMFLKGCENVAAFGIAGADIIKLWR
jgi:hypothetical protein